MERDRSACTSADVRWAVSLIGSPTVTDAVAVVVNPLGQLLIDTCSGATKSLISDVNESEERLFR